MNPSHYDLSNIEAMEIVGHTFDILRLERQGEHWLAHFAVDGVLVPPFYEPHHNVVEMNADTFLVHMKSQALAMAAYGQGAQA